MPVKWRVKRPVAEAVREKGLFASQLSTCKLRDQHPIDFVTKAFGIDDD